MSVGSNGQLHRSASQVSQDFPELRMHSVLTRPEIHRANRESLHHGFHLTDGQTIRASRIAVAERARKIAFVGKPEPERNARIQVHTLRYASRVSEKCLPTIGGRDHLLANSVPVWPIVLPTIAFARRLRIFVLRLPWLESARAALDTAREQARQERSPRGRKLSPRSVQVFR